MEPLRLLIGLVFAMMSVGVLVFPAAWPFSRGEAPTVPDTNIRVAEPVISLAEIPTDTVLTVQPIIVQPSAPSKELADQLSMAKYFAAEKQFDEALDVLAALPFKIKTDMKSCSCARVYSLGLDATSRQSKSSSA